MAILYLRPFDIDAFQVEQPGLLKLGQSVSITEIVVVVCEEMGEHLTAISDPLGSAGAGTVVVDEEWESGVLEALDEVDAAIIVAGVSPGTVWEMRTLAETDLPVLVLRNPRLTTLDSSLLQAAAWDVFDGITQERAFAADAIAFVRTLAGLDPLPGSLNYKSLTIVIRDWIAAVRDTRHMRPQKGANSAPPMSEPVDRLLAVAAGFRRALRELDDRRDAAIKVGEAGEAALVGYTLASAAYCGALDDLGIRLNHVCDAFNTRTNGGYANSAEIWSTYCDRLEGGRRGLLVRFVEQVALLPGNDWRQFLDYSIQVERVADLWATRLEKAAERVWSER